MAVAVNNTDNVKSEDFSGVQSLAGVSFGSVEVGLIESLGEYGDQSNDVTFAAIGDSRMRHAKGARDAGTLAVKRSEKVI